MLTLPSSVRVFVATDPVDFRKAFDGLSAIVRETLLEDPLSGHVFLFFNKGRDRAKLLFWDRIGFWLFYRRLERGRFETPLHLGREGPSIEIDMPRLQMLLAGIDLKKARFRRHFATGLRRQM